MIFLIVSAGTIGFIHSLSPAHWMPLALLSRTRKWNTVQTLLGAVVASSGHIILSVLITVAVVKLGVRLNADFEEVIELYAAKGLVILGVTYALYHYVNHRRCHGHTHHGPAQNEARRGTFLFLFSLGLSPCVAVLPALVAVEPYGPGALMLAALAFSIGVVSALAIATLLMRAGTSWLDHPLFEHYGDVVSGLALAVVGGILIALG
jgi:ABC-type nickel/cobalt efflux system permease component RcnA